MQIAGREIGGGEPPFIVAEISGNHGGQIENAIELIRWAATVGADAVKTQCFDPDSMTIDCNNIDFIAQGGLWSGQSLYELYSKCCTPPEWHKTLYQEAKDVGIPIFSSVFNVRDIDLLERLGCPVYKIASFEITDIPLIKEVASTGKPMIISTGLASNKEIVDAASAIKQTPACFLHCTSDYPGTVEGAGLDRMTLINSLLEFRYPIGISDHTNDFMVPIAATARRAAVIEKHLCLPDVECEDNEFSLIPEDFGTMVEAVKLIHLGCKFTPHHNNGNSQFRRSLYAVKDIAEGETFTYSNIRSIRPGYGLPPHMLPSLIGTPSKRAYKKGDRLR